MSGHHHVNTNKKILLVAFSLTFFFTIVEIAFGFITNSLSLLSEGFHMLSDSFSLFLSFIAVVVGTKLPTLSKTFGFKRFETIAAFINGLALLIIPIFVLIEAIKRFFGKHEILGEDMLIVATIGLIINLIVAFVLSKGDTNENLNLKAAFLHVFADLTSSVGVIIASLLIINFGWVFVDSIVSIIVSIVILIGGIKVTIESFNILMEGTPQHINIEKLTAEISLIEGIKHVEQIKVWSISSHYDCINIHVSILSDHLEKDVLHSIKKITSSLQLHETIQIEKA